MYTTLQQHVIDSLIAKGYKWDEGLTVSCAAPVLKGHSDMYIFGVDGHIVKMSLDCKTLEALHTA